MTPINNICRQIGFYYLIFILLSFLAASKLSCFHIFHAHLSFVLINNNQVLYKFVNTGGGYNYIAVYIKSTM